MLRFRRNVAGNIHSHYNINTKFSIGPHPDEGTK